MQVGDVVIPVGRAVLACGSGYYDCAIVANVEPFALASVEADMLWTCTIGPGDVRALCQAAPDIVARAVKRYESHTSNKTDDVCASLRAHNRQADGSALPKIEEK